MSSALGEADAVAAGEAVAVPEVPHEAHPKHSTTAIAKAVSFFFMKILLLFLRSVGTNIFRYSSTE
jgi:hypothetical protein